MHRKFIFGLLAILVGCLTSCATRVETSKVGLSDTLSVNVKFTPGARLSTDQIAQVESLAKECGVPEVTSIETF